MKKKAALFWSGGKDSAFALHNIQINYPEMEVMCLITTLNQDYKRISMHGIREELLDKQAEAVGISLQKMWVTNDPTNITYERELNRILSQLKDSGIENIVFGDIFLEDLKQYRDNILQKHGLTGIYPLWKKESVQLIYDFISSGFRALTCCISNNYLDKTWLGKEINEAFILDLPSTVNPCGENGEFHTFCFDGPIFSSGIRFNLGDELFKPLSIQTTGIKKDEGFWYVDIEDVVGYEV
jgi:uncharacterized protein (TIGR00290 family)